MFLLSIYFSDATHLNSNSVEPSLANLAGEAVTLIVSTSSPFSLQKALASL
jgi:hypothetical protein